MKAMIEILESRTLLSAGPVAASFVPMQTEMIVAPLTIVYTSPLGRYTGARTSTRGNGSDGITIVIQQWNTVAGTMQVKLINSDGSVQKGLRGTIVSGRNFTFHFQAEPTKIVTITGKVGANYIAITGTYVVRNLAGVLKDRGNFAVSR